MRLKVKICGITSVEDAWAAAEAGADALGLNFVSGPRQIDLARAAEILEALPPFVTPVALVRLDQGRVPDDLLELLGEFWVSHLQVYGEVTTGSLAILAQTGFRVLPVLPVRDEAFPEAAAKWLLKDAGHRPSAIVLDTHDPERAGGTGRSFPWDWVASACRAGRLAGWPPIILAGGLRPENVAQAVRSASPYGVDVSSGVEIDGSPGRKDPAKMRAFVHNATGN